MDRNILLSRFPLPSDLLAFDPVRGWSLFPSNPAVDPGSSSRIPILPYAADYRLSAANRKWSEKRSVGLT